MITSIIQVPQNVSEIAILPLCYITEILKAYQISTIGCEELELRNIITKLFTKKTFQPIVDVVTSNRYPYTIMFIAAKIGMYIPPKLRIGIETYNFFINNIHHYEHIRLKQKNPEKMELVYSNNPKVFLYSLRDDMILTKGYKFTRNYKDRSEMIEDFYKENLQKYGHFTLLSNHKKIYDHNIKTFLYENPTEKHMYSSDEIIKMVSSNMVDLHIILDLKKKILEKLGQFRMDEDSGTESKLHSILEICERITEDQKSRELYFGNFMME